NQFGKCVHGSGPPNAPWPLRASDQLLMTDVLVDVHVVVPGVVPGIVIAHAVEHQIPEILGIRVPQSDRAAQRRLDARRIRLMEAGPDPMVRWPRREVPVEHGLTEAAHGPYDRDSAVL